MTGNWISVAVEVVVAVLLTITIGYCVLLNARLKRLRADETHLRATIGELLRATEVAERAIGGLRAAAQECDKTLARRVREAEFFSAEIAREIGEGTAVLDRIVQITQAARGASPAPLPRPDAGDDEAEAAAEPARTPPPVAPPRLSELRLKVAQSAERLASLRRGMDGEAA